MPDVRLETASPGVFAKHRSTRSVANLQLAAQRPRLCLRAPGLPVIDDEIFLPTFGTPAALAAP